jgi:spore coat polysaccharide biosynthesis protein SpsF
MNPERRAVIIQARRASTRLPDKVLLSVDGRSFLRRVVERCRSIPSIDAVVCAIPDSPGHDELAEEARRAGAVVYAGSENDVLARYLGAAELVQADIVLRVTSDCPLIDPEICESVLNLRQTTGADYACNNLPVSWPHGLDCEAFPRTLLAEACRLAELPAEREHVTPWLRTHPALRRANLPGPGGLATLDRWTLDYPEDLVFFQALLPLLPTDALAGWQTVTRVLDAHPDIRRLNANRRDPARNPAPGQAE